MFLENFQRLFSTQFAIIVANFIILSLFRSSIVLNIKDDFSTAPANKSDYNQLKGVF